MSAIPPVNHVTGASIKISNIQGTLDLIKIEPDKIGFLGANPVAAHAHLVNLSAAAQTGTYVQADINTQLDLIITRVNTLTATLQALGFIAP